MDDQNGFIDPDNPIITLYRPTDKVDHIFITGKQTSLFTPGQTVTTGAGELRGHGTYEDGEEVKSSVSGVMQKVTKLILVRPVKCRYPGYMGDVVVGRVIEIQQKRWKVDINYRLDATLLLSSINLPGGELRRRSVEDERMMRKYFREGDLISAEVQNIHSDGAIFLHTRNLKYGKLTNGLLVCVSPSLIKRCKTHFMTIEGMSVILGNNGLIWMQMLSEQDQMGGFSKNVNIEMNQQDAEGLVRLRTCILALAKSRLLIHHTSMNHAFDVSKKYQLFELCRPEVMLDIAKSSYQVENLNL